MGPWIRSLPDFRRIPQTDFYLGNMYCYHPSNVVDNTYCTAVYRSVTGITRDLG